MGLKKANACISLLLVVLFLAHSVYELIACLLLYNDPVTIRVFGLTVASFVSVHAVLSAISYFKNHDSKTIAYPKLNIRTMLQRISAVLILLLLPLHMRTAGMVIPNDISTASVILEAVQVVFFGLLYLHIAVSFSRALITLGWITEERTKKRIDLIAWILCSLLFAAQSVVVFATHMSLAGLNG